MISKVGAAMPDGIGLTVVGSTAHDDRVAVETEVQGVSPTGKVYHDRNFFAVATIHTNEVLFNRAHDRTEKLPLLPVRQDEVVEREGADDVERQPPPV
jgi:hypothetical protein